LGISGRLENLDLSQNQLIRLPTALGQLLHLKELNLSDNRLTELPVNLGQLLHLKELNLSDNRLTELPANLGQLLHLKELNLSDNQLHQLPDRLRQLKNLRVLDLSRNDLTDLPEAFEELKRLHILNLNHNQFEELPNWLRNTNLYLLHIQGNRLDINEPYLYDYQIKAYFETKNSVNDNYALAERTLDQINKSSDADTRDFLVEIIEGAKELYKSISDLASTTNTWVSQSLKTLQSYVAEYIVNSLIGDEFLWAYLERLANGGLDYEKAKQQVDHLKEIHPGATKEQLCDLLVQNKFMAATGAELQTKIQYVDQYNFLSVSALLEELVFQIGYCYGFYRFQEFNWLEDLVVFAIVYNTERLKRLGVDGIESITSTSEISGFCISGFANFVMFQAIGYTAKFYYSSKGQRLKLHEFLSRYEKLEQSGIGLGDLVEQHISQKVQVEQTLDITVNATRDILSYQADRYESKQKRQERKTETQTSTKVEDPQPKTSYSSSPPQRDQLRLDLSSSQPITEKEFKSLQDDKPNSQEPSQPVKNKTEELIVLILTAIIAIPIIVLYIVVLLVVIGIIIVLIALFISLTFGFISLIFSGLSWVWSYITGWSFTGFI
jgi:hypothetical protein